MKIDKIKESKDFLPVLLENIQSVVIVVDREIKVKDYNNAFKKMVGKTEEEIQDGPLGNVVECRFAVDSEEECGETDRCKYCILRNDIIEAIAQKIPVYQERLSREFVINGESNEKHFIYSVNNVDFLGDKMALVILDDITEFENCRQAAEKAVIMDVLTEIHNKRFIMGRLEQEYAASIRHTKKLSIIVIDIDNLKAINDKFGIPAGDEVLKRAAKTMSETIRTEDEIGRYGGDEFLAILPNIDIIGAFLCAERLRKAIAKLVFSHKELKVTISLGIAELREENIYEFLEHADKKMYEAKTRGRNRIEG